MIINSEKPGRAPKVVPGFEHINRYWDRQMNTYAAKILPGEFYVSTEGEMIVTVLGSCVSACIRDRVIGVGGMNHFMLPLKNEEASNWNNDAFASRAARYGNWSMEFLINELIKLGGKKKNFEVKIFGGGKVLTNMTNIGAGNVSFVREFLRCEGLSIAAEDVGDIYPRKVLYFPDTGAVKMKKLKKVANSTVEQREQRYIETIKEKPQEGGVELF